MKRIIYIALMGLPGLLLSQIPIDNLPYEYRASPELTEWKIAVFPIDYTDIPAHIRARYPTKEAWHDTLFNGMISELYSKISYGNLKITGTVFDYTTSTLEYWTPGTELVKSSEEVVQSVDIQAPGIDMDDYDAAFFLSCHDAALGQSVTSLWKCIINGDTIDWQAGIVGYYQNGWTYRDSIRQIHYNDSFTDQREYIIYLEKDSVETGFVYHNFSDFAFTMAHELGHSMGVPHANTGTNGEKYDYEEEIPNNGDLMNYEYGNSYSLMGHGTYGISMTGAFRDYIGFMDSSYMYSANWYGTSTATVFPINRNTGKRFIEVLLPHQVNNNPDFVLKNNRYGLELREIDDLDTMLVHPQLSENLKGFFVTKINGLQNRLLDMSPSPNIDYWGTNADIRDMVLKPGMTYENDEVKFTNVKENGDGSFSVDITIKTDKTVPAPVEFTTCKRIGQADGEIRLEWTNPCVSCTADQELFLAYRNVDSLAWDTLGTANLLAESFTTTSSFTGKPGKFEFRSHIVGNATHTASLYSSSIEEEDFVASLEDRKGQALDIKIYPNPATEILNLHTNWPVSGIVEVSDIRGKVLYSEAVQDAQHYQLKIDLSNGIYILRYMQENMEPFVKKIIVQ